MWKSKFYDAFVLNHIVVLHAIDATPARWHGDADSSPLDGTSAATPSLRNDLVKNCRVHLMHWLISTQLAAVFAGAVSGEGARLDLRRLALRAVVGDAHFYGLCSSGAFFLPLLPAPLTMSAKRLSAKRQRPGLAVGY